jgi:hypothetical protein
MMTIQPLWRDRHRSRRTGLALHASALASIILAFPVQAFELTRTSTQARWVNAAEVAPYVDLAFSAEITRVTTAEGDLIASWTGNDVMGIQPTPFQLFIPADCFRSSAGSLQVRNHRACGVKAIVEVDSLGQLELPIYALSATLTEWAGYARLTITAAIGTGSVVGDLTNTLLGSLGGASQQVQIGSESGSLYPNAIEVLGFNPQPEPPP